MNKFIFQTEKQEKEEGILLNFYYIDDQNKTKVDNFNVSYLILVKKQDFESLNIKSDKIILAEKQFKNKNEEEVIQVEINNKELYEYIMSQIKEKEFETYEYDVLRDHKYIINTNLPIFESKSNKKPQLKYVSIDIETIGLKEDMRIVSISCHNLDKINKVYLNKEKIGLEKVKEIEKKSFKEFELVIVSDEKELLEKFKQDIIDFEPQAIIGWNVIDFDFKVMRDRMKEHSIEFKFSKFDGECKLRIYEDFFKDSTLICSGVLILDIIQLLKTNFISFEDYKLNTVAKEVLGEEKVNIDDEDDEGFEQKVHAIENLYYQNPVKLVEYNFKDSVLVSKIMSKLSLLDLMIQRSIVTGTPFSKVKSPIATLDIMYLKELHKRGLVAPSNFNYTDSAQIEGAYVITPKKGFYKDIFVFDFKSLYPSIIMTFNIDPFTYSEKEGNILAPNGAKFTSKPGILPELILTLYKERDVAKKEKDPIKSYALKTTMNSFYGAMASPKSRFYNREVGGAITAFGREIIQKAKKFIENNGHKVIYGDTDSIFVKFSKEFSSLEDKKAFGFELEREINDFFEKWVNDEYKQKNYLKIELEKLFSNFFIASKKRYVGYDEFSSKIAITGMEAIRGDWTELAKNFQIELINQIFSDKKKEDIKKYILDYVAKLKKGEFNDLLIYKKKITKPLHEYVKMTPPHVKAAREVSGFSGRLVKYIMSDKGPLHVSLINENTIYDYEHYIDKQLKGVSDDLLEAIEIDFDEILKKKQQKNLNQFF